MNRTKRLIAGIMAVSTIMTLPSCSSKSGGGLSPNKTAEPQTADKVIEKAYAAIELDADIPMDNVENITPLGDSGSYLVVGYSDKGTKMCVTDSEFLDFTPLDFELEKADNIESYYHPYALSDGTIAIYVSISDYGDAEMPNWDDPDFDYESFDFDTFYNSADYTYRICTMDREGNILTDNEITDLDKFKPSEDERVYLSNFYAVGDKMISTVGGDMDTSYYVIGFDGKIGEKLDLDENDYLYDAGKNTDGDLVFSSWDEEGSLLKTLDAKTLKYKGDPIRLKDTEVGMNIRSIASGSGDYSVYLSVNRGLYGMKPDGTTEEVINWTDSDLNGDYITSILALENGDFIIVEHDWSTSSSKSTIYRLTKRDVSELANTKIITLVTSSGDSDLNNVVRAFNQSHTDYRIKIEDYSNYYDWDENTNEYLNTPENQLKMDIAAGKQFDIMILNSTNSLYPNLASKGMFTDLYDYLGKDGGVKKEDLLPNVLKACESNGKLYGISPEFNLSTYAIKTKFTDKTSWTFDEMMEVYNQNSDKMRLFQYTTDKASVFSSLYYNIAGSFIDFTKGTCSFDSPEFIKILDFINDMDIESVHDWESMTDEDYEAFDKDRETAIAEDRALLSEVYFHDMRQYSAARYATFAEPITLIGSPTNSGNGAKLSLGWIFSITASSPSKEACWEFISQFFEHSYYDRQFKHMIPSVKSELTTMLDEAMEDPYWIDENGDKQYHKYQQWINGKSMDIPNLTKEERDMLEEYILSAESTDTYYYNDKIDKIVNEEITAFFAGEHTAQQTADLLQNRISILVSEQS